MTSPKAKISIIPSVDEVDSCRVPLPPWVRYVRTSLLLGLFGYLLIEQENVNFFILCGRILPVLVAPLVALRDFDSKIPVAATSVEYHIQTLTIVGMISYALALWLLLMSPSSNPLDPLLYGNRTKEHLAFGIAASYESFDEFFLHTYCSPFVVKLKNFTWDVIIEGLLMPVFMIGMLTIHKCDIENKKWLSVTIASFFIYRFIRLLREYNAVESLKSETTPMVRFMTLGLEKEPSAIVSPYSDGSKYVWNIYGNRYDMTDFVAHHPGGTEAIMLAANREDATALFQSYHPFNIRKAKAVLEKYRLEPTRKSSKTTPSTNQQKEIGHENDLFYDELVRRVSKTLLEHNIDPVKDRTGTLLRNTYYVFIIAAVVATGILHCKGYFVASILFGLAGAFMGGNVGHDGGHFAISRIPLVNDLAVWGMSLVCNPIIWQHQHTYSHHVHSNEHDHDPDLHHFHAWMRYTPFQRFFEWHKNQFSSLYVLFAFMFTCWGTCHWNTIRFTFERSLYGAVDWSDRKRLSRTLQLLLHNVMYCTIVMVAPFYAYKSSCIALLAGLTPMIAAGVYFAFFSQVGHITEKALCRDVTKSKELRRGIAQNSWAAEQIEVANDFCPQSLMWSFVSANLSLQIEHHLFPSLNHCHLHLIQPIVEQACKEYNVDYKCYTTFGELLDEFFAHIKNLSIDDDGRDDKIK